MLFVVNGFRQIEVARSVLLGRIMRLLRRLLRSRFTTRQTAMLVLMPVVAGLVSLACGSTKSPSGAANPNDDGGAQSAAQTPDATPFDAGAPVVDARSDAKGVQPDAGDLSCVFTGGGGSSSGKSCTTSESYSCTNGSVDIDCSCPQGTCTCGGATFNNSCANGCEIPEAIRVQCGAVNIVEEDGGGSSSGGGSSGGSSSSSSSGK